MNRLQEIVERFAGTKILVVGDAMTDVYHFGRVTKLSQEAPVPVFVTELTDGRPGGAANVSAQLQVLGCDVTNSFARPSERCIKHRWIQGTHQVFREDHDFHATPDIPDITRTLGALRCDQKALVLSDYAKGWCSVGMCQELLANALELRIPAVVDPKGSDWLKYQGATVLCPNEQEFATTAPKPGGSAIAIKLGANGILLMGDYADFSSERFPAKARHVYDVTGAGDTVTAIIAAGLAVGSGLADAARLANLAAGWVVGEVGTASCSAAQLIELAREIE
jgi:bifunctional ADP-heptose synthase (sugar kinase/adenylyltransferase)